MSALLLVVMMLSSPAHASSESTARPTIVRCDHETPNRNSRCVGVSQKIPALIAAFPPPMVSNMPDEETDSPLFADERDFYKVEKWTKDGTKVDRMLYAGGNLDKARQIFNEAIGHRPRIQLTIRQRTRVLAQWPEK
jgi:hypothetical protein